MNRSDRALVFDIKRFSVHDGQGLRTTVFFKGCPLRCAWCQNPEGLEAVPRAVYMKNRCIGCRLCSAFVPWMDGPVLSGSSDEAVDACPAGAITPDSSWYSLEELMAEILKDEVFFRRGGGVTFSGGEPLLQGHFLVSLAKACKEAGIHTAMESTFYAPAQLVQELVPWIDQIFCDVKVLDGELHQQFTGVSNSLILSNLAWMLGNPEVRDKVTVRTPLIPGMTGTEENVRDISAYIHGLYPHVKYELLNYNPLAPAKYELAGKVWSLGELTPFSQEEMDRFRLAAKEAGITNLIEE